MRLLYCGESGCDFRTLKRLGLLAEEIAFMDYPAVSFGNWGMVGHDSWYRQVLSSPEDPVRISTHAAPAGPPSALLLKYLEPDVTSPEFRSAFLDGLADERFARKFFALDREYAVRSGLLKGRDIVAALRADEGLRAGPLEPQWNTTDPEAGFDISAPDNRRRILSRELMKASVHVTSAMIVGDEAGCVPVSDDPHFGRLLTLRAGLPRYVGGVSRMTPFLGLEIMRALIPDDVLEQLEVKDVWDYRAATRDAYQAWASEINQMGARIDELDVGALPRELPRILAMELQPRVLAYRNELRSARDRMFGGLVKDLTGWKLPTLSAVAIAGFNIPGALAAFAAGVIATLPHVVDYYVARRDVGRKHAVSYVVGVTPELGAGWDRDAGVFKSEI